MRRPVTLWLAGALLVLTAVFAASASAGAGKGHDGHPDGQDAQASQQPQQERQRAGTKPGNDTSKWTMTHVGDKPDVAKRYGNASTAAQIPKSRGSPVDTVLAGPGNS